MPNYRSKFEVQVRAALPSSFKYEPHSIAYTSEHNYTPDFVRGKLLIEVKGRFRNSAEARKYVDIKEQHPDKEIVFIFMRPSCPLPGARVRKKCGTKRTHGEWATSHGFRWYTLAQLKKETL